ncbi:hypothetical protein CRG98_036882 [Punica granatum]|nr:hypothetical protein CRG98_036882 [Punica granatum]
MPWRPRNDVGWQSRLWSRRLLPACFPLSASASAPAAVTHSQSHLPPPPLRAGSIPPNIYPPFSISAPTVFLAILAPPTMASPAAGAPSTTTPPALVAKFPDSWKISPVVFVAALALHAAIASAFPALPSDPKSISPAFPVAARAVPPAAWAIPLAALAPFNNVSVAMPAPSAIVSPAFVAKFPDSPQQFR